MAFTVAVVLAAPGACTSDPAPGTGQPTTTVGTVAAEPIGIVEHRPVLEILPPETATGEDVLHELGPDGVPTLAYRLGPPVESAIVSAVPEPEPYDVTRWRINLVLAAGPDGIDAMNDAARLCHDRDATCPTGQLALVADDLVISAPRIQPDTTEFSPFAAEGIIISGNLDRAGAEALVQQMLAR